MRLFTHFRPTPSMVVAITALVFSMSGFAAAQILPNPLPLQKLAPSTPPPTRIVRTGALIPHQGYALASCQPGEVAVGGGGVGGVADLFRSSPARDDRPAVDGETPNGWAVSSSFGPGDPGTTAYAICERP